MDTNKMMRAMAVVGMVCAGGGNLLANPPNVSNVTLAQPKGTRQALVGYTTDGPGIATFQFKTNGVDICHSEVVRTVTGDISKYIPSAGNYTFTWDAGRDFPERVAANLTVEVTLWATNSPPTYCAVSLVEQGGQYPVRFYGKESEVPFGVTNSWWKKDWLLMRQIPSTGGEFVTLGSPSGELTRNATREVLRSVRVTKPFYMGVFHVTQRQWGDINGDNPSYHNNAEVYEERPVEQVSYHAIRGAAANGYDWPNDGHAVAAASFMGRLRAKTGGALVFDLPTEAQWEYACRAGTSGAWNNGTTITNATRDANLALLGRYRHNGGYVNDGADAPPQNCGDENGTAKVGSYLPNAWGLYDMHGNVWDTVLDWLVEDGADPSLAGDDPVGPATGTVRICRGGAYSYTAQDARAARRASSSPSGGSRDYGFRVAAPAEVLIGQ